MENKYRKLVGTSVLASMATLLQLLEIPIIPTFSFLKIDFSDIPVLVGFFIYGPMSGILVALIRSFLHSIYTGLMPPNIVGDIASFLASNIFCLPIFYFFKHNKFKYNRIFGMVISTLSLTIFMSIVNYFILTPLYLKIYGVTTQQLLGVTMTRYIAIGIIPFNLIKGSIISTVFLLVYFKLFPLIINKNSNPDCLK